MTEEEMKMVRFRVDIGNDKEGYYQAIFDLDHIYKSIKSRLKSECTLNLWPEDK